MIAFGIMDALLEEKIRIPGEISVLGCDNTIYSSLHAISLTTIDHFVSLKGRDACEIIIKKIHSQRTYHEGSEPISTYHIEYEPKLIARHSTSYVRTGEIQRRRNKKEKESDGKKINRTAKNY